MSVSIKRIGPEPPTLNREYKKRPLPVTGTGKLITVLPTDYRPAPTYEIPPEDPERRKRIVEAQRKAMEAKKAKEQAEAEKPKRKPRQNRVWTPEKIEQFKALYNQGLTYPQIAAEMGMKPTQINQRHITCGSWARLANGYHATFGARKKWSDSTNSAQMA